MSDMLVKLYELPPLQPALDAIRETGIEVRPARVGEEYVIGPWVQRQFNEVWSQGITYAIHRNPCSLFIAVEKQSPDINRSDLYQLPMERLVGFACYDVSHRGLFGPIGVAGSSQRQGIGKALALTALHAMWMENYAYAVIGWAGPVEWYKKIIGATIIPGSEPGPFRGALQG
jgi:hypothetical protein